MPRKPNAEAIKHSLLVEPSKKTKKRLGRPPLYRPKFCQLLVDHMAKGLSYETFSASIDVCVDLLYTWESKHPNFNEAKKIGTQKRRMFFERVGVAGVFNLPTGMSRVNAPIWIFSMKAFCGVDEGGSQDNSNLTLNYNLDKEPAE